MAVLRKRDYMTIPQMINYAAAQYPELKKELLNEERASSCYQSMYQKIKRTLEEYKYKTWAKRESDFEQNKLPKDKPSDVSIKKYKSNEEYYIPAPFAECVIDRIMQEYLYERYGDIDNKAKAMIEAQITKPLKEQMEMQIIKRTKKPTEKEFAKLDKQVNDIYNQSLMECDWKEFYDYSSFDKTEKTVDNEYHIPRVSYDDYSIDFENRVLCTMLCSFINLNEEKFREDFREQVKHINKITLDCHSPAFKDGVFEKMLLSFVNFDEKDSCKDLKEHKEQVKRINKITFEYYSPDFENMVICKMLCAFIKTLYDFHEDEFRKDLDERSNHIESGGLNAFSSGFSELTWKLENFVCNYIFPLETTKRM